MSDQTSFCADIIMCLSTLQCSSLCLATVYNTCFLYSCDPVFVKRCRARATDQAVQVMDEAKDSVPSLQLTRHEILTGSVHMLHSIRGEVVRLRTDP